ncbi:MAG: 50S ribosomal protein L6 [Spirochaetes bacterium]|nr:50S ribosomal protein L6 [Spirochaetota bacterium]
MSRIGKKPIVIPNGVSVDVSGNVITVKGPLGTLQRELQNSINVAIENNMINITKKDPQSKDKKVNALWGLTRALINNMVIGVSAGFEKNLEIVGVGYRATQKSNDVEFQLGYSHSILFSPPAGTKVEVVEPTKLRVKGIDKQLVGQVAANIRKLRPPEPYKGKGIRYKDEQIRRKAGKTGK